MFLFEYEWWRSAGTAIPYMKWLESMCKEEGEEMNNIPDLSRLTQPTQNIIIENCNIEVLLDASTGNAGLRIKDMGNPTQPVVILEFKSPMGLMLFINALLAIGTAPAHPMARKPSPPHNGGSNKQ